MITTFKHCRHFNVLSNTPMSSCKMFKKMDADAYGFERDKMAYTGCIKTKNEYTVYHQRDCYED